MDYKPSKVMHEIIICGQEMNNVYRVKRAESVERLALIFCLFL